jgi:hypothetical protein
VRVLPEHVSQRNDLRGRFEREARAMADADNEVEIKERAATVFQHIFYPYKKQPKITYATNDSNNWDDRYGEDRKSAVRTGNMVGDSEIILKRSSGKSAGLGTRSRLVI